MLIRKATPNDSTPITAAILLAMDDIIYRFIGDNTTERAFHFVEDLVREKGNQYSYENCWVAESENEVVGAAVVYDGARLQELREPVANRLMELFNREFNPEDETQAGEFYIDCVGVDPAHQGKGIGTGLFRFLIDTYVIQQSKTLGLLVDTTNPKAKELYLKLGFEIVGTKKLVGKDMLHLQFGPTPSVV